MKILDCTIRDGGYYTNWDFNKDLVKLYLESLNNLPVEYLEVGYRSPKLKNYYGEYYYCPIYVLESIKKISNKKLVIILNEKDIKIEQIVALLSPCKEIITMVRLAIDPQNMDRAIVLAEKIKSMGFEIGFNVMYMSKWKGQNQFLNEIKHINGIADVFYMVDSYGGIYPEQVRETFDIVRNQTNVPIGFHGHNNLELALINSLTAIDCGAEMIDATITGMGRGAGNLKTELLLTALNARDGLTLDFNALADVTDAFTKLQTEYGWGTNLPYMVSGANSLPQKDVMEWITKRFYSINSILRALNNQKDKVKDNEQFPVFSQAKKYKKVIILGGGLSAIEHQEAVKQLVSTHNDICIIHASSRHALIYKSLNVNQYFCLVGNEGNRLEKIFSDLGNFNGQCILPAYPRKMGTYVPKIISEKVFELKQVTFTENLNDTHTAIALQCSIELGAEQIYFVGYDGYAGRNLNQREIDLLNENESLFQSFNKATNLKLVSLTPTIYKELIPESIYPYL